MLSLVPYLQQLGTTALELLPVFQFNAQDCPPGMVNYWGYQPPGTQWPDGKRRHGYLNTADLVNRVASEQNVSKDHVRKIVDTVIAAITAAAIAQEEVTLTGFGRFKVTARPPVRDAILAPAKRSRSPPPGS